MTQYESSISMTVHRVSRILMCALLTAVCITGTAEARRTRFVEEIVVTSAGTPAPFGGGKWTQVTDRDKLESLIQHPTPGYRNIWLPVPFEESLMATDTTTIVSYYRNRGYLDARVISAGLEPVENEQNLPIYNILIVVDGVEERQRYQLAGIRLNGAASLDTARLARTFRKHHRGGRYYSPAAAADNLLNLRIAYADAGYLDSSAVRIVQAPVVDYQNRTVTERYIIWERRPVRIGEIRLVSQDTLKTEEGVVLEALADAGISPGRILGRRTIVDAETNLLDLGVFRIARIRPDTVTVPEAPWIRRVLIELAESDPGQFETRAGFTRTTSGQTWRLGQSITYGNLFGQARTIGAEAKLVNDRQNIAVIYGQPTIGFPDFVPLVGGMSARFRHDQEIGVEWEDIDTQDSTSGVQQVSTNRTIGTTATISRRYARVARTGISLELGRTDYNTSGWFDSDSTSGIRSALSLYTTYDSRDQFLNPTKGFVANTRFTVAGLNFNRRPPLFITEGMVGYYRRVTKRVIVAFTAAGGVIYASGDAELSDIQNESFWKSSQTSPVRGFSRDDITEGSPAYGYWMTKGELRFTIWKLFGAAVFADAGSGWTYQSTSRGWSALRRGNTMVSAGLGPRINWVLPIRLDFVRQLTRPVENQSDDSATPEQNTPGWKIEFGIGHAF